MAIAPYNECYYLDGSYNGIYPNTPMFFKDETLQELGFNIIRSLCDFYANLDEELRSAVTGVTLMNEPAHMISDDAEVMLQWLKSAVNIFRDQVVTSYSPHPDLFVNLIASCMSDQDMLDFMVSTFSAEELNSWAILDVHVYYAWSGADAGCTVRFGYLSVQ